MIRIAAAFAAGIAAFRFSPFFPVTLCVGCILWTGGNSLVQFFRQGRIALPRTIALLLVAASGFYYAYAREDQRPDIRFPPGDLVVNGTVAGVPERTGNKIRFTLVNVTIEGTGIRGRVRLLILPEMFEEGFDDRLLKPGARVSALAKLSPPRFFRDPGLFSVKPEETAAAGYVKTMKVMERDYGRSLWTAGKRHQLGALIDASLSQEAASLHRAIIAGLKGGISPQMRDAFSETGLAHLLSISGTHFGLLAFLLFSMIRGVVKVMPVKYFTVMTLFITPTQTAAVVTMPILAVYAGLSGGSTPTIRSFIMVLISMTALLLGRRGQWLNSLSLAAVVLLLWEPALLFDISFILSFSAVISIGYAVDGKARSIQKAAAGTEAGQRHRQSIPAMACEKIMTTLLITASALMGTAPIVAMCFSQFPLISPVTNLLITPFICFVVLPLGLTSAVIALVFGLPVLPLHVLIDGITHGCLRIIKIFSVIPYGQLHVSQPSPALAAFFYISLVFILKGRTWWRFAPFMLVLSLYMAIPCFSGNDLRVTFLDVGQGDAAVVELRDNRIMLIDGGTGEPDMGRAVIAPWLRSRGIGTIDYLVMSHPHPDHIGGLLHILDNFTVREVWYNGSIHGEAAAYFERAVNRNITWRAIARGEALVREQYRIYVLHPYDGFSALSPRGEFSDENSRSLVLKLVSPDGSFLFTGDAEEEAEQNLLHLGGWLASDILKVPHHGGRTSSSHGFIDTVHPLIAVVSAGRANPFNHPHGDTLDRLRSAGVRIFRTDRDGAVTITAKKGSYEIETREHRQFIRAETWRDELRNLALLFR